MKYERLTMKTVNGYGISGELVIQKQPAVDIAIDSFDIVINRLAELEDKIENGTLVELPCKVGDTVWELDLFSKAKIREIKARNLLQIFHWIDDESFGKFLFLTKTEAEEKLKELEK